MSLKAATIDINGITSLNLANIMVKLPVAPNKLLKTPSVRKFKAPVSNPAPLDAYS